MQETKIFAGGTRGPPYAYAIRRRWLTIVNACRWLTIVNAQTRCWSVFGLEGTQRLASCAWAMVMLKLGNRWKWKGECWFHYRNVLFVGAVGIAEAWF